MTIDASIFPPVIAMGDLYRNPKSCAFRYDHKSAQRGCCIEWIVELHARRELTGSETEPCKTCGRVWYKHTIKGEWTLNKHERERTRSKPRTQTLGQMVRAKTAKRGTR